MQQITKTRRRIRTGLMSAKLARSWFPSLRLHTVPQKAESDGAADHMVFSILPLHILLRTIDVL